MKHIINQIHKLLIKNKKTVAVAESCTGGLLSCLLTSISGSSKYFVLGLVLYSNEAKSSVLNIPGRTIAKKGAVSEEVAMAMSRGVRKLAKTDFGIGITGIAGPTAGTALKPVGTVFISVADKKQVICRGFHFRGNRQIIRKAAALETLKLLKGFL